MQEVIQQVMQRAGISQDDATEAVGAVLDFVKQRVPTPIATEIERVLSGDTASAASAVTGALGGMFGKKEEE
ncbi:MAG TPA: hypothetical protein VJR70_01435 [Stellaceae bacterium]|nr:hypothetical protein [Stellaceae bacterium]